MMRTGYSIQQRVSYQQQKNPNSEGNRRWEKEKENTAERAGAPQKGVRESLVMTLQKPPGGK